MITDRYVDSSLAYQGAGPVAVRRRHPPAVPLGDQRAAPGPHRAARRRPRRRAAAGPRRGRAPTGWSGSRSTSTSGSGGRSGRSPTRRRTATWWSTRAATPTRWPRWCARGRQAAGRPPRRAATGVPVRRRPQWLRRTPVRSPRGRRERPAARRRAAARRRRAPEHRTDGPGRVAPATPSAGPTPAVVARRPRAPGRRPRRAASAGRADASRRAASTGRRPRRVAPLRAAGRRARRAAAMTAWDEVVGQPQAVAVLQDAAAAAERVVAGAGAAPGSMTHAWLFTGPPGSGRSVAARAFAAALQCERGGVGCGECSGCHTRPRPHPPRRAPRGARGPVDRRPGDAVDRAHRGPAAGARPLAGRAGRGRRPADRGGVERTAQGGGGAAEPNGLPALRAVDPPRRRVGHDPVPLPGGPAARAGRRTRSPTCWCAATASTRRRPSGRRRRLRATSAGPGGWPATRRRARAAQGGAVGAGRR